MNIIFWIMVIAVLFLCWLMLNGLFKCIGSLGKSLWDEAQNAMADDEQDEGEDKSNE